MAVDTMPVIDLGTLPPVERPAPRRRLRPLLTAAALVAAAGLGYLAHSEPTPAPAVPASCDRALLAAARYMAAVNSDMPYSEIRVHLAATEREFDEAIRACPTSG